MTQGDLLNTTSTRGIMELCLNGRGVRSWFLEGKRPPLGSYNLRLKDGNNSTSLTQRPILTGFLSRRSRTAKKKKKKSTLINKETRTPLYFAENPMDTQWTGAGQPLDQGLGCQRQPHLTFDLNDK